METSSSGLDAQYQRAVLLMQQERYEQAISTLQLALADHPDSGLVHATIASCLVQLNRIPEAQSAAEQGVGLAPYLAFAHRILSRVQIEQKRYADAEASIQEAIQIDQNDPANWSTLGEVYFRQEKLEKALHATEQGLAVDPEHGTCQHLRSLILVRLGRHNEASATTEAAVARNPLDPRAHANRGWALMHAGKPRESMTYFREALRLDPEYDWARAGIVEALKARNFIYRWMLAYFLWMSRLPSQTRIGVIIGGYIGIQLLRGFAAQNPWIAPYLLPLFAVYGIFAIMTWLSVPLFNLLLRLDPFGRYALSSDQILGANCLGLVLLAAILSIIPAVLTGDSGWVWIAIVFGASSLLVSGTFMCSPGRPRWIMGLYTLAIMTMGLIPGVVDAFNIQGFPQKSFVTMLEYFPWGIVGGAFLAMFLSGWEN